MWRDARLYQILFLGLLLGAGAWLRDFSLRPAQVVLTFAAGWLTQAACERLWGVRRSGTLSALITSFSLSILLRAGNRWAHPLAAAVAIAGKFVLRARGKHLFNPGNLGIVFALILLPGTWTSPGQWGHDLAFAAWFVSLGVVVTSKARRGDVSWAFLAFYLGAIALRVAWLGQSRAVWLHQLSNGSLLLFAFFMISDPMTIPNHPRGRAAHAALVAAVAFLWQYALYRPNGPLWALFLCAPAVPLWDLLWPAAKFEWRSVTPKGDRHETGSTPSQHPAPAAPAGVGGPLGFPLPHPGA